MAAGARVLVVDDVEEMRMLIRRALTSCGYEVDVAATLAEARGMGPGGYDAVLIDAHIGAERGIDLIEALRSADPATARRCLVMSGGSADALPDGVGFLAKPFQRTELIAAVRRLHQPDAAAPDRLAATGQSPGARPAARPGSSEQADGRRRPEAARDQAWQLLELTRRVRARERHELIDFLHDGPIQELAAATLDLQMMSQPDPPGTARTAPGGAVQEQLDAAARSLRWLVDGNWPFLAPETQLGAAIQQRTAWLLATPASVRTGGPAAGLDPAEVSVVADCVEMMLLGILTAGQPAHADIAVQTEERLHKIELAVTSATGNGQPAADAASAQTALDALASALGASAHVVPCGPGWRARLVLRRQAGPPTTCPNAT